MLEVAQVAEFGCRVAVVAYSIRVDGSYFHTFVSCHGREKHLFEDYVGTYVCVAELFSVEIVVAEKATYLFMKLTQKTVSLPPQKPRL